MPPLLSLSLDCDGPSFKERSGGVAVIVCDATGNTVQQGVLLHLLDGPIRVNRFADSRESPDSHEWFSGFPNRTPFLANRASGAKKLQITGLRRFARIARAL